MPPPEPPPPPENPYETTADQKDIARRWLEDFADSVDADYGEMIYVAQTHYDSHMNVEGKYKTWPDYLIDGGKWEGESTPDEFWDHFCTLKDLKPMTDETYRPGIFSCSC